MDEFFFHLSQHFETVQVHLLSALQYARQLTLTFGESAGRAFNEHWSLHVRTLSQHSVALIQSAARHCSTVLAQPSEVYYQLSEMVRIEMPILYPGGAGFLTGAIVGVIIGLSWQKPGPPLQRMKTVVCMAYDGLDALCCIDDAITPTIKQPHQLIVQVKSASVDIVDLRICYGYGQALRQFLGVSNLNSKGNLPVTLGRDCSGIVIDIGPSVNKFEIGDEVWLVSPFWSSGTIAELVLANEDMVAKKPRGKVLIHSGVSPVGCIACQLARLHGCDVTVTCSSRAAAVARALGAKHVVVYGQMDLETQLLQDRFDVVLNTVGGVTDESCLTLCKPDGVFVSTVLSPIRYDEYTFPMSFIHNCYLRFKSLAMKLTGKADKWSEVEFSGSVLEKLGELVDQGHVQPVVDKVFAPQDTALALQHCDSADAIGKTVVRFRNKAGQETSTRKVPGMYITSL